MSGSAEYTTLTKAALTLLVAGSTLIAIFLLRRLVFHPLARFPGPITAALTSFYEDSFEVYGDANYDYIWQIKKLHQRYGPIVRINPHEIHIDDPSFYASLNSFKGRWDKDPHTAAQFANPFSSVGTVDHETHKKRKAAVQPFFAKQKIQQLEPVIVEKALQLCDRIYRYDDNDDHVVPLRQALKCFCVDTIAEYCFAKSGNMLDKPRFAAEYWSNFAKGLDAGMRARYLPKWLSLSTAKVAPAWIRASIGPGVEYFGQWHTDVQSSVDSIRSEKGKPASEVSVHRTIFHEILNSSHLDAEDKSRQRLVQEGAAMIGAGGETTSQVLGIIIFSLLNDRTKLNALRKELEATTTPGSGSSLPSLTVLESLPYLTGCIKEGLRLRTGKIGRQQRVPKQSIFYKDIEIKAGTICSMTPVFSQIVPDVFPNPHSFQPDRWVDIADEERLVMERHLVAFSKGTRMCTGMSLGMAMMYICIASVALSLELELYETSAWDNEMAVDAEKHSPLKTSKGLRVVVKLDEKRHKMLY